VKMALLAQGGFQDPASAAIMALSGGLLQGNLGAGLLGANNAFAQAQERQRAAQEAAMQGRLREMQMKNYESEIAARGLAAEKEARKNRLVEGLLGSGVSMSPGAFAPSADGMGPVMPESAAPAAGGGLTNLNINQVAALKLAGVDLGDLYKFAQTPQEFKGGSIYRDPVTGAERTIPKLPEGMTMNGGRAGFVPGFAQSQVGLEAERQAAIEAAKAAQDLVTVTGEDGIPRLVTRASVTTPQQPQRQPSMQVTPEQQRGADTERIRILQQELRNPNLPAADRQAITNELQRTQTAQVTPGFPQSLGVQAGPSPAQIAANKASETRAVEQAKADVKPTAQRESAIAAGNYMSNLLGRAISHPGLGTATGLSGTLDPRNYVPGTDATNFRSMLDQIKGSAFLQAFESLKGGGQITELEGKRATDAIARLNTAQSDEEFKAALTEFKGVIDAANRRMTGGKPAETPKPAGNAFSSLPPAPQYKGKIAVDQETGDRYKSNGLTWVKQ